MQFTNTAPRPARLSGVHTPQPQRRSAPGRLGDGKRESSISRVAKMHGYSLGPPMRVPASPLRKMVTSGMVTSSMVTSSMVTSTVQPSTKAAIKTPITPRPSLGPAMKVPAGKTASPLRNILPKKVKVKVTVPIPTFGDMTITIESSDCQDEAGLTGSKPNVDHYRYV